MTDLPNTGPLAKFIWGEDRLQRRLDILEALTDHPTFRRTNLHGLARKDYWAYKVQQSKELIDIWFAKDWNRDHFLEAVRMVGDVPAFTQFRSRLPQLCQQP